CRPAIANAFDAIWAFTAGRSLIANGRRGGTGRLSPQRSFHSRAVCGAAPLANFLCRPFLDERFKFLASVNSLADQEAVHRVDCGVEPLVSRQKVESFFK